MSGAAEVIPLGPLDLGIASGLVLVAGVVSVALGLGLERRLGIASLRTVVQLLLIGYLLEWIFAIDRAALVLGVMGLMIAAAGRAAIDRPSRTFAGVYLGALGTLTLTGTATTLAVTGVIIGVEPWYRPQYLIPLLGMVLGNGLTGISLCLDQLLESLAERREEVEAHLALGATRWEAARDTVADAVRRGMIPIINAMSVAGIVSLPGMMTGQILAGARPVDAVMYQIVVMFMIAGATSLGCVLIAMFAYRRLTNERHQLRAERIRRRRRD